MDIRKAFYKIYWRLKGFIAPTLKNSQYLYEDILQSHINPNIEWLDIGCGHQILPSWRSDEEKSLIRNCKMVVGIDYDLNSLRDHKNILLKVRGNITKLPFKNQSFDLVTANMVVEHLDKPATQFQEINRILKPGGIFIFHTPNIFGYTTAIARLIPNIVKDKLIYLLQGRREKDIFDTYYRGNTRREIYKLSANTGFQVMKIKMIVSSAQFVVIPPLVIFELIWIRLLMTKPFKPLRTNIIAILKKSPL